MNKYTAQGDGFPADNEFLMLIQSIIGEVAQLATIGGTNYVLKGCEVVGGNAAAGWMVINGEILEFEGGAVNTHIAISETVENATYLEDLSPVDGQGDSKPTYFYRKAVFAAAGTPWASIEKSPLAEIKRRLPPVACPQLYFGSVAAIPEGWQLCDGTNGLPDLTGKFVVGYDPGDVDYDAIGKEGGAKGVILTEAQMPSHSHTGTVTIPSHKHNLPKSVPSVGGGSSNQLSNSNNIGHSLVTETSMGGGGTASVSTNTKGSSQSHENRPPYYTLAYIGYVGV